MIAVNKNTGFERSTLTSDAGIYNFLRLPVGTYDVTVEAKGFRPVKRTGLALGIGAVATVNVSLEIGSSTEMVTVNSEVPVVETTRSQTSTVVNDKAVRDLPINGRNFLDFALLTPGVSSDPRGGDLSFGGQRGTANSLLVDGGDSNNLFFGQSSGRAGVRNPYAFSQDAVQEFQVNTEWVQRRNWSRRRWRYQRGDQVRDQRVPRRRLLVLPRQGHEREHVHQ